MAVALLLTVATALTAFSATVREAMKEAGVYTVPDFAGYYGYKENYTEENRYNEGVAISESYDDVEESDFLSCCEFLEEIGYSRFDKDVTITPARSNQFMSTPRTAYYTYWY